VKTLKYIPLQFVLFQIIGILIGFYIPISPKMIAITLSISFLFLLFLYVVKYRKITQNSYFAFATFSLFIGIGIASVTFSNALNKQNHYTNYLSETSNTAILRIDKVLKSNSYYHRYFAEVRIINSQHSHGKILLNVLIDSSKQKFHINTKIVILKAFRPIHNPANPYQFNYKKYLKKQQVHYQTSIKSRAFIRLKNKKNTLNSWAFFIRNKIDKSLKKAHFKGDELAIINALVLGQRQEISKEIMQDYQNAGAVHILAVSGLHIGIILLLLNFLFRPLERLKHGLLIKLILILSLLWIYAFIAGMSASIVRAVTMFTAIAISLTVKKAIDVYKALIISIFFLLLFNPYYLFDVGFQLSYAAVFFIVYTQPILYKLWKPKLKIIDYFWQLLTVSIAAQFGVLPLSLFYFHQFPGLFFISNLVIIPFLGFILGFGILVIVLALLELLPNFIAQFYENVIFMLNTIVAWIGKQELFVFENLSFTATSVGFYFLMTFSFFKWTSTKEPKHFKLTLVILILFQVNLLLEKQKAETTHEFIIFNKTGASIIGIRTKSQLEINHTLKSSLPQKENSIKGYLIGTKSKLDRIENPLKSIYQFNNKKLLVIDSLGVYSVQKFIPDYILLTNSPSLNLERLIQSLKPKLIIADASNYQTHIKLWRKTCLTYNIRFVYTVKEGAFLEKL